MHSIVLSINTSESVKSGSQTETRRAVDASEWNLNHR